MPVRSLPYKVLHDVNAPLKIIKITNPNVNGIYDFSVAEIERRQQGDLKKLEINCIRIKH